MAISTYSELQTAVQNWLDDTGANVLLAARVQEFIALAEADISRRLRIRENLGEVTGNTVAATATLALPTDFGGVFSLSITTGEGERSLRQIPAGVALDGFYAEGNGEPSRYVLEGANARLFPTPDAVYAYTLRYWQRLAALSNSNTSNWLLAAHQDVYLFGSLVQAELYKVNDPRVPLWQAKYEAALEQVTAQSALDSIGRTDMQVEGGTP
jgi:hypothetical protein